MDMSEVEAFEKDGHQLFGKALAKKFIPAELAKELNARQMDHHAFAKLYLGEPEMPNFPCHGQPFAKVNSLEFSRVRPFDHQMIMGLDFATIEARVTVATSRDEITWFLDELADVDKAIMDAMKMVPPPKTADWAQQPTHPWPPLGGMARKAEAEQCERLAELLLWEPSEDDDVRYQQERGAWLRRTTREQVVTPLGEMDEHGQVKMQEKVRPVHHVCAFGKALMMVGRRATEAIKGVREAFQGLTEATIAVVIRMNDGGASFESIATELMGRAATLRSVA